jgi:hypothetical protein
VLLIRIQSDAEIQAKCLIRNKNSQTTFLTKSTLTCVRGTGSYTGTVLIRIFIVVFPGFGKIPGRSEISHYWCESIPHPCDKSSSPLKIIN